MGLSAWDMAAGYPEKANGFTKIWQAMLAATPDQEQSG